MDEMRCWKPSVKTVLGITQRKKWFKKALSIHKHLASFRRVKNYQRHLLRRAGNYAPR